MPEELLDYYGNRFLTLRLGDALQISFEDYLADPDGCEQTLFYLTVGGDRAGGEAELVKFTVH